MGKIWNYMKNNISFFTKIDKEDHESIFDAENFHNEFRKNTVHSFKNKICKIKNKIIFGLKFKW